MDFITNFPWFSWLASASNVAMILATAHWFPWSFHLGHKLNQYWAFVCGCIAIIFSFGLWALQENMGLAWLVFTACMLLLHWPGWRLKAIHRINYVLAYIITSIPVLAAFGVWAIWEGDSKASIALAGVSGLYVVGGIATIAFNTLDKLGMSENFDRINHHHKR